MSEQATQTEATKISQADYEKAVQRAQTFEAKVTDFEKRFKDVDPEKYKALLEEEQIRKREQAAGDPKAMEAWQTEKEQEIAGRFNSKFEEQKTTIQKQEAELKELRVVSVAMKDAAEHFNSDALGLIETVIRQQCDWQDGKIVVKGEDGKPRYSKASPRDLMTTGELMAELAEKYPSCAKATAVGGAKQSGTNKAPGLTNAQVISMTPSEQRAYFAKHPEEADRVLKGR